MGDRGPVPVGTGSAAEPRLGGVVGAGALAAVLFGLGAFVVDNAVARFVALADAQEGRPALADVLPASVQVVVSGQQALRDGQQLGK